MSKSIVFRVFRQVKHLYKQEKLKLRIFFSPTKLN